jgi:hypothetical protein
MHQEAPDRRRPDRHAALPDQAPTLPPLGSQAPPYGPDYPHWMDLRVYGVTGEGVAYDLPLPKREPGRCPVEGCGCLDAAETR